MSVKYFCDRCGEECPKQLYITVPGRQSFDKSFLRRFIGGFTITPDISDENTQCKAEVNICKKCFKEFTGIELKD